MDGRFLIHAALFAALFAWFCLPGYLLARALRNGPIDPPMLITQGFAYSLAIFALGAWPCLWWRISAETCWLILGVFWLASPLPLLLLNRRLNCDSPGRAPAGGESPSIAEVRPAPPVERWLTVFLLLDYLAVCGLLAANLAGKLSPLLPLPSVELACFIGWVSLDLLLSPGLRAFASIETPKPVRDRAPMLWTIAAALSVGALAAGVAFAARPDWDDSWYLSAVHRYSEGGPLNREGFSLPGEDFVPPHMRLLAWELFGATLCRFSGVHPMASHHTLLPPMLVLMAAAANWRLFSRHLLSPRLAPLAMIGLCG